MAIEEPVVLELLAGLPAGPVLDAACGTGRYMGHLAAAGREDAFEQALTGLPTVIVWEVEAV